MKTIFTSKRSISMLIFIIIGTVFLIMGYKLIKPVLYFIGACICLAGLIKLTFLKKDNTPTADYVFDLVEGILDLFLGVIVIKFHDFHYVVFTIGIIYLIIPIIRLCMAMNKLNQLFVDSLKYLASIVMISCIREEQLSGYVVAAIFYGIAVFIFVTLIIKARRIKRSEYLDEIEN